MVTTVAIHGFTYGGELPDLDDQVLDALYSESRSNADGSRGGRLVFPWVEIDGRRFYLVELPWKCQYCGVPRFVEHDPTCENA